MTDILETIGNQEDNPPKKTWADVRLQRDNALLDAERKYNFDSPEEIINAWKEYKQKLRDIPETYKDLEDLDKIEWPQLPDVSQQLTTSFLTR
jgi:hypothetical protein